MDWTWFHQLGQLEFWEGLLAGFENLGPLVPILLAAVESCSGGGCSSGFSGSWPAAPASWNGRSSG